MFYGSETEIALMSGGAFAVTHHPVSSEQEGQLIETEATGAPQNTIITKSVSWQHHPVDAQRYDYSTNNTVSLGAVGTSAVSLGLTQITHVPEGR